MEEMTLSQFVEGYRALSEQMYRQYRERRDLEWRIHVALWSLLAAATYLCVSNCIHLRWWSLVSVVAVPLQFAWVAKIVRGEVFEQNLSIHYRHQAEAILQRSMRGIENDLSTPRRSEEASKFPQWMEWLFAPYWWWPAVQISATSLLCGVLIALAW